MININEIIQNAFQRCSLVGDGQSATGTQSMAGLADLKCLINELNAQNLLLDNAKSVDIVATDEIRIADKLPENWIYLEGGYEDIDVNEYDVGTIIKLSIPHNGYDFYVIGETGTPSGRVKYKYSTKGLCIGMRKAWPHLIISELPDRVEGIGRKIGERFVQLKPAEKTFIDSYTKQGLSKFYAVNTESVITDAENNYYMNVLKINFDSMTPSTYRITYLQNIKDIKLTDTLFLNKKYESLLEDGLCAKLCLRYKLLDVKPVFDEEYQNGVRLIKRINKANRPMNYSDLTGDSWYDNYANGHSGFGW